MSTLEIFAEDLFDGAQWTGPATVVVEGGQIAAVRPGGDPQDAELSGAAVMPGLVDSGVSAVGYTEVPSVDDPFGPEAAFAGLCLRYGVTTVIDVNNTLAGVAYLDALARSHDGPRVVAAGGRLSTAPSSRQDVLVDARSVDGVIAGQHAAGAQIVSVGDIADAAVSAAVLTRARALSLAVAISRQVPCETPGLMFAAAGALARMDELPPPDHEDGDGGTLLAPQLEAVARWTVDGLMHAHDAAEAAAFLPYARNFARSGGGAVGRRIGRTILRRYYGDRDPEAVRDRDAPAVAALRARRCLASSGSGAAGLVPGASLWAELACLHAVAGAGSEDGSVLFAATGAADELLGALRVGRVRPGYQADLLVLDAPGRGRDPGGLWESLTHVVVGGHPSPVETMASNVDATNLKAMKAGA